MSSVLTIVPGQDCCGLQLGGLVQMQAAGEVEADPLGVSPGFPEDGPSVVPHPQASAVEEVVLGVVFQAVSDDEVEVLFKLVQVPVTMSVYPFPHGGKVHRVFDDIQVVWDLKLKQIRSHSSHSFPSGASSAASLVWFE